MVNAVRGLGETIRALRTGFAASRLGWVRISDAGAGRWLVECAPFGRLPGSGRGGFVYRAIQGEADTLLDLVEGMRLVTCFRAPFRFFVDAEGRKVR